MISFFEKNKIWYMPLKGCVIEKIYPEIGSREMVDNDILYDFKYQKEVKTYMIENGYSVEKMGASHHDTYIKLPFYSFELHTSLFGVGHKDIFVDYYKNLKDKMIKDENHDYEYYLSDDDFYIYMIVHNYKHYENGGIGFRALLDIYLYWNSKKTNLHMDYIQQELEKLGVLEFQEKCKNLSEKLFCYPPKFKQLSFENLKLMSYMDVSGSSGLVGNRVENRFLKDNEEGCKNGKLKYCIERVFPEKKFMQEYFPFCGNHQWFIPIFYVYRLAVILFTRPQNIKREWLAVHNVNYRSRKEKDNQIYYYLDQMGQLTDSLKIKILSSSFKKNWGYCMDFENPVSLNQKLMWLKVYYQNPLLEKYSDVLALKKQVEKVVGLNHSIPVIHSWKKPSDIDFTKLPNQFVLKMNWSNNFRIVVKDAKEINVEKIVNQLKEWILPYNNDYYTSFNIGYKNITPMIYAEKYISEMANQDKTYDYQFCCYNGKLKQIIVVMNSLKKKTLFLFDSEFRLISSKRKKSIKKPKHFEKMQSFAEKLSQLFPFTCVHLYEIGDDIYIDRMTFDLEEEQALLKLGELDFKWGEDLSITNFDQLYK